MSIANWKASSRNNQQISYSDRPFESLLKSNEKDELTFCFECGKSDSRNAYSQDRGKRKHLTPLGSLFLDPQEVPSSAGLRLAVLWVVIIWLCVCACLVMSNSFCPWDSLGKSARMDCHFLLQEIFLIQKLNPCLLRWQAASLPLEPPRRSYSLWLHFRFPVSLCP